MRLLLLSNSTNEGSGYLDHAWPSVLRWLAGARRIVFVPFALKDHAAYAAIVRRRFLKEGIEVEELAAGPEGKKSLEKAEAVFVGGGNTFRLLDKLQRWGLLEPLRERSRAGMPYMGSSAGTNLAGPTVKTTNDMPIVFPRDLNALGLVPFQLNPHYFDPRPGVPGETREQRLSEFLEENETPVLALREGAWLELQDGRLRLEGTGARLFRRGERPRELPPGGLPPSFQ